MKRNFRMVLAFIFALALVMGLTSAQADIYDGALGNAIKVRDNNAGSITKEVGDTGSYQRLPRLVDKCMWCGGVAREFIPDDYWCSVELSNPEVLADCRFTMDDWTGGQGYDGWPCLNFKYTAAKPGTTDVKLTFYYQYDAPAESGYCSNWYCGEYLSCPANSNHYYETTTFTVTVNGDIYTVTYTDGVEGEEVFADQVTEVLSGAATPEFVGTPTRDGYVFAGWNPELAGTVTADATYDATWKEDRNGNGTADEEEETYTVTYTDGVEDTEVFADQVTEGLLYGDATPAFEGDEPSRVSYIFAGWDPKVTDTVNGSVTYTAQWIRLPGASSCNVTNELFTIQCTTNHEHKWVVNWFGIHVEYVKGSAQWNAAESRWEAQAKIGSSMMSQINSTQPKKNYFGGIKHYYDETNFVFDLYYNPDFTGMNSQKEVVTGMWLPVSDYVIDVYCYDKPAAPSDATVQKLSKLIWMRDAGDTKNYLKPTKLYAGTYAVGEMYKENGEFYANLTITDLAPYVADFNAKYGGGYAIGDWEVNYTAEDFAYILKYTGSKIDYVQDDTGWSVDASSYANNSEKSNGKTLWLTKQYTVTYTDGVEDAEVFADQSFTCSAMTESGKDTFTATATPRIDDPVRDGYVFTGWTPEVAATVTADATYTATWEEEKKFSVTYVLYVDNGAEPYKTDTIACEEGASVADVLAGVEIAKTNKNAVDYAFSGWMINGEAIGDAVVDGEITVTGTIYNKFAVYKTVIVKNGNGEQIGKTREQYGTVTVLDYADYDMSPAALDGYEFDGWYQAEKDIGTASKKLSALKQAKKYELYGVLTCAHEKDADGYCVAENCGHAENCCEAKPDVPACEALDLQALRDLYMKVAINCEKNSYHSGTFALYDNRAAGVTINAPVANDGSDSNYPASKYPWKCVVTLDAEYWFDLYQELGNHMNIEHELIDANAEVSYTFYADTNGYWYRGGFFNTFDIELTHK